MAAPKKPDAIEVRDDPHTELEALAAIISSLESFQSSTRLRMFRYLRDRYSSDWPYSE